MVKSIAVYFEGGGSTNATKELLRRGMSTFLKPVVDVVRSRRLQWRLIPCGGRQRAYEAFVDALERESEVFNVLLVDSEDPLAITAAPWTHLRNRVDDQWLMPAGADDSRCQMMVACMEAWFLADPEGLKRHYGGNLDLAKLPAAHLAESRNKANINDALSKATRDTAAGEYQKIRDGAKLLERVDPGVVRKQCKWCERLFKTLGDAVGAAV